MKKLGLMENIDRTARAGVAAVAVATLGIVALAGTAPASAIAIRKGPVTPLPTCPSPVLLSNTYSYTYNTATDQVLSLSGSGCSQSAAPLGVFVSQLGKGNSAIEIAVSPKPVIGTLEDSFSFTANGSNSAIEGQDFAEFPGNYHLIATNLYLTQSAANAASGGYGSTPITISFEAANSGISFTLYSPWIYYAE